MKSRSRQSSLPHSNRICLLRLWGLAYVFPQREHEYGAPLSVGCSGVSDNGDNWLVAVLLVDDDDLDLSRSLWSRFVLTDDLGSKPKPLINGNCGEFGTCPICAVDCAVLFDIADDAACERFWAWTAATAAFLSSIRHVAGVKSRKSHGCSSVGDDDICPSFVFKSERKTKMR